MVDFQSDIPDSLFRFSQTQVPGHSADTAGGSPSIAVCSDFSLME